MATGAAFTDELIGQVIVAANSEAVVASDREGLIRFWSPGAERIFGHSAAEALGQSLDLIIPERLRARLARLPPRHGRRPKPIQRWRTALCACPTKGWVAAVGRVHHHSDPARGR